MIAGVGLGDCGKFVGIRLPVQFSGVDNDTAEACAVTADELCGGVDNNVSPVLERAHQIRCAESIVYNQRQIVAVGYLRKGVKVGDIGVGVAECLSENSFGVGLDCRLDCLWVAHIDKCGFYAARLECVGYKVVRPAVDIVCGYYVVACAGDVFKSIRHSRRSAGNRKSGNSAFKGGYALFKNILCGIGQASVDVSRLFQRKPVGGMLRVAKHVRSCLVDRYGAGIGSRVRLFLTYMKLQCFKM